MCGTDPFSLTLSLGVMSLRRHSLSLALIAVAAVMVLFGTLYFASLRPGYSHISNTISELGETGASPAHLVAFGFFLPVGLMIWLAVWLMHRETLDKDASLVLVAMSCLGTGYVVSALFSCDPGAPLFGSWRTLVHNAAGLVDCGGTAIGFLLVCRYCARRKATTQATVFGVGGGLVLICLAALCVRSAFPLRGAVQRVAELIQFTGVFLVCLLLPRTRRPKSLERMRAGHVSYQHGYLAPPTSLSSAVGRRYALVHMNPINKIRDWWLAWLLRRAAAEMRRPGSQDIPFTEFRTTLDFAEFLEAAAGKRGDTTDGERLWRLFAPTCSWDDAGGSQGMGDLIYGTVGHRFFPRRPTSSSSASQRV
jgi:hypothetical protein